MHLNDAQYILFFSKRIFLSLNKVKIKFQPEKCPLLLNKKNMHELQSVRDFPVKAFSLV